MEAYEDVKNGARKLGSPEANKQLVTLEGFTELVFLHGRLHQPEMTRSDWEEVIIAALKEDAQKLVDAIGEAKGVPSPTQKHLIHRRRQTAPRLGRRPPLLRRSLRMGPRRVGRLSVIELRGYLEREQCADEHKRQALGNGQRAGNLN